MADVVLQPGMELRPVEPAEFPAYYATSSHAFGAQVRDDDREHELETFEFDRSLGVFDKGEPVATTAAYTLDMAVPGGSAPVAGVTWVAVAAPYRRRGLLTALMTRQLTDLHEGGEAVAALWASEATIYGRFGYGLAAWDAALEVRRGDSAFTRPVAWSGRLRTADPADALPAMQAVYERLWRDRPGHFARGAGRWSHRLHDPDYTRDGASPRRCVLHEDDDGTV